MTNQPEKALILYEHGGRTYPASLIATSFQDAEAHLASLKRTGKVEGWPSYEYRPNSVTLPLVALWVRLKAWWLNLRANGPS